MEKKNTFDFKIKVETATKDISDLYDACEAMENEKTKFKKFSEVVTPCMNATAEKKLEMILEQVKPLIELSKKLSQHHEIAITIKKPDNKEYVAKIKDGRTGEIELFVNCSGDHTFGIHTVNVKEILLSNPNYVLSNDNPFTRWNEWGVFDALKEELIGTFKLYAKSYKKSSDALSAAYARIVSD